MYRTTVRNSLMLVVAVVTLAVMNGDSQAGLDSKIYAGSQCHPGASGFSFTDYTYTYDDAAYTQNYAGRIGIVCPVVRDQVLGTSNASAYMLVSGVAATDVWCGLYAVDEAAGTVAYGSATTSAPGRVYMSMTTPTQASWYSVINLCCNLSQNAMIYSYNIDENLQIE